VNFPEKILSADAHILRPDAIMRWPSGTTTRPFKRGSATRRSTAHRLGAPDWVEGLWR
jgi:hypothetical protein